MADDGSPGRCVPNNSRQTCRNKAWKDMTLRDYFAAAALTGLVAAPEAMMGMREVGKDYGMGVEQYASRMAYEMADAMLKERQEFRS